MIELDITYWNKLAGQLIVISSLLSGFSIAVTANLLVSQSHTPITNNILRAATVASGCFLVALFALTNLLLKTTEGYPFEVSPGDISLSRALGAVTLLVGTISLTAVIALSGWTRSKRLGIFTTAVGVITLILIILSTS